MTSFRLRRPTRLALTAACLALGAATMSASADLDKLQAGSSKEQVRTVVGSPSTVSTVDGEAWYYISSKFETVAFYAPEEVERTVAAVYFDKTDVVQ